MNVIITGRWIITIAFLAWMFGETGFYSVTIGFFLLFAALEILAAALRNPPLPPLLTELADAARERSNPP